MYESSSGIIVIVIMSQVPVVAVVVVVMVANSIYVRTQSYFISFLVGILYSLSFLLRAQMRKSIVQHTKCAITSAGYLSFSHKSLYPLRVRLQNASAWLIYHLTTLSIFFFEKGISFLPEALHSSLQFLEYLISSSF